MQRIMVAAMCVAAFLAASCSKLEQRSALGGPCDADEDCVWHQGYICVEHKCVSSSKPEPSPEVPPEFAEPTSDVMEAADADGTSLEATDVAEAEAGDLVPDEAAIEVSADGEEAEAFDIAPEETAVPVPGLPCSLDSQCAQGKCVDPAEGDANTLGKKVCTAPCPDAGACPVGMACIPVQKVDAAYTYQCRSLPEGLCTPCGTSEDCPILGSQCLAMTGGTYCGAPCPDLACPDGFHCVTIDVAGIPVEFKRQCVPVIGTCACSDATKNETFTCAVTNAAAGTARSGAKCLGEMTCAPDVGWGKCNAFLPEAELCDGVDNDCNGQTDEGYSIVDWDGKTTRLLGQPCGIGECAGGVVQCAPTKTTAQCSTDWKKLAQEICGNGRDDDCNGQVDDLAKCYSNDLDGDGDPNGSDCFPWDASRHHDVVGKPDAVEPCCPSSVPADQALKVCDFNCDGVVTPCLMHDNDHDGYVDKAYGGDDCNDNDATVHPGAPEECDDGIDQDCNGSDLHCCTVAGEQDCAIDNDGDHWPVPFDCNDNNKDIHPHADEYCNNIDDNCNGIVDEGNPGGKAPDGTYVAGGTPCGPNVGECKSGTWVCSHYPPPGGAKMECIGAIGPTAEVCDDKDNNCDGQTDEAFVKKGTACDGDDLDQCKHGSWTCMADGSDVECVNESIRDLVEICSNNKDDDCDGVTDNGCMPDDIDGDGYFTTGVKKDCNDLRADFHPGAPEPCCDPTLSLQDALTVCDRNCDGHVTYCDPNDHDHDGHVAVGFKDAAGADGDDCNDTDPTIYPGAPEKCGDGTIQNCNNKSDIPCSQVVDADGDGYSPPADCNDDDNTIHPWATEKCNDVDDDCNGVTDDGNPGGGDPCGSDVGECAAGVTVCVHYAYQAKIVCLPQQAAVAEICDGKDNNCNGRTDEWWPTLGQPCDGPDLDLCPNGVFVCSTDGKGVVCGPELVENLVEVCDGKDNNCDGLTDEGFSYEGANIGGDCKGQGECGTGKVECAATDNKHATCSSNPDGSASQANPEVCNGRDDDCDGAIDNGMLYHGLAIGKLCLGYGTCGLGVVECGADGTATCSTNPNGSHSKARPELCNGLDDNCNGHTDEGVTPTLYDCGFRGVCSGLVIPAQCVKGTWNCTYDGVADFAAEELFCDGKDNNCNGVTDENFPYDGATVGQACQGLGECGGGVVECASQMKSTCSTHPDGTAHQSQPEVCDLKDNDCDGLTDEDFSYKGLAMGAACHGVGQCGDGLVVCSSVGPDATCSTNPDGGSSQAKAESCNGLDDDCDGVTDNGFEVGNACAGPGSLCFNGHFECNLAGDGVDCIGWDNTSTVEVCDGKDNDCDGAIDNGFTYQLHAVGDPCLGIGQCGAGTVVCASLDRATCSTNPDGTESQAQTEICDGLDNNCDGTTDEGQLWQGLALQADCLMPGVCGAGKVVCSPTDFVATCSTAANGTDPQVSPEWCDGLDNDCNGLTDDGLTDPKLSDCMKKGVCGAGDVQFVQALCSTGIWLCDYTAVPHYEAGLEASCDGRDNDCDGLTDEDFTYVDWDGTVRHVGEPCGIGACANGVVVCNLAGNGLDCSTASKAKTEVCLNSIDDDCDGLTDEEASPATTTTCPSTYTQYYKDLDGDLHGQLGVFKCYCKNHAVTPFTALVGNDCDDNNPNVFPGHPELCNGIDDNCNAQIDEGAQWTNKGKACDGPDADLCANGTWACDPASPGGALTCVGDHNSPELCNGLDDDCNGLTDDGFLYNGIGIYKVPTDIAQGHNVCKGTGECGTGTVECSADGTMAACSTNPNGSASQAKTEKCNNLDDDCDGLTDEDYPTKGQACDGPDLDLCKQGTFTCTGDGTGVQCINEPVPPSPATTEICDNVDNDCNGVIDDPWIAKKGLKCDVVANVSGGPACSTGQWVCNFAFSDVQCVDPTGLAHGNQHLPERECVSNAKCVDILSPTVSDTCRCFSGSTQGDECYTDTGNTCAGTVCLCGSSAACTGTKKCISGTCQ